MIRYTTGYHLFIRLVIAFGGMFLAILPAWFITEVVIVFGMPRAYEGIPFMAVWVACIVYEIRLTDRHQDTLDAIAAYFYIRETLKTHVTFGEAEALSFLFLADKNRKWYPVREVKKLPKAERRGYLFAFAQSVAASRQEASR